ncbi:MAG: sugar ABC transporter ATP-binding protein [Verrucomicrobiae bacterium]|nr:sugar ABC transporter ATP-binding protein [Verrucomicrobiae bacterium]
MNSTTNHPVLRAERLVKRFPGVTALKGVSFTLRPGEIHALCGENGAGKSTLIKTLSGLHPAGSYEGTLFVGDRPARFRSIADAEAAGIAVIYQELALVEEMTVAENLFLGDEPRRGFFVDWDQVYRDARAQLEHFGIRLHPASPVRRLGIGQKQLVEIAKALRKESRILILDEPTAALTETEVAALLDILRDLRRRGISCVYVSHKLDEVFSIADRITVLRDGESVVTLDVKATDRQAVIRHMVGREIHDLFPKRVSPPGERRLTARRLSAEASRGKGAFLRDISFEVRAGEVLGIGGLMGAGRSELLRHLFGAWGRRLAGEVELDGRPFRAANPADALRQGLAFVSEDRKRYGLIPEQDVGFNLSLSSLRAFATHGFLQNAREHRENRAWFDSLRVKAPTLETPVAQLSGGNQQKVLLGRALMAAPRVIFLDEPTRGIDVGAKVEIYAWMNRLTAEGRAVVLASSELAELLGMSDRILMLCEGGVGGAFARAEATPEKLLAAAMARKGRGSGVEGRVRQKETS